MFVCEFETWLVHRVIARSIATPLNRTERDWMGHPRLCGPPVQSLRPAYAFSSPPPRQVL